MGIIITKYCDGYHRYSTPVMPLLNPSNPSPKYCKKNQINDEIKASTDAGKGCEDHKL
jgi:hypothetical protein